MKSMKQSAFIVLAVMIALASCTVEKRIHMSGYHLEWLNGKDASDKQTARVPTKKWEESQRAPESLRQSATYTLGDDAHQPEAEQHGMVQGNAIVLASADNPALMVSPQSPLSFYQPEIHELRTIAEETNTAITQTENSAQGEQSAQSEPSKDKSWITALLLCIFLGGLGIHRFYLGYTWQGVVQLLTAGGCGVWALIDLVRIIMRDLQPKDGQYKD